MQLNLPLQAVSSMAYRASSSALRAVGWDAVTTGSLSVIFFLCVGEKQKYLSGKGRKSRRMALKAPNMGPIFGAIAALMYA